MMDRVPMWATVLPLVESPLGSGFSTALGIGSYFTSGDIDYWRIDAEAEDRLSVRLESDSDNIYPTLYLQNSAGANLATANGDRYGHLGFRVG